jgi:hypothetical protein
MFTLAPHQNIQKKIVLVKINNFSNIIKKIQLKDNLVRL